MSHRKSYKISKIKEVQFRFIPKPTLLNVMLSGRLKSKSAKSPIYLALILSDNQSIKIGNVIFSDPNTLMQPGGSWRRHIGQQIATFLGVPYIEKESVKSDYFNNTVLDF